MLAPEQQGAFLQIYVLGDVTNEKNIRCGNFPEVKPGLVGLNDNVVEVTLFIRHLQLLNKNKKLKLLK